MPYDPKYYRAKKQYYLDKNREKRQKMAQYVRDQKTGKPCMDCGQIYPFYVMDFDHRDPSTKVAIMNRITYGYSWKRLYAELAKCDLVCSNCHRIRTHDRAYAVPRMGSGTRKNKQAALAQQVEQRIRN